MSKIKNIVRKGKVVGRQPTELTDLEKVRMAIIKYLNLDKTERLGREHLYLIPESVVLKTHSKIPLEAGKNRNMYGYMKYHHTAVVEFKIHREYNPKPDGNWGSHKYVSFKGSLTFTDIDEKQWKNLQDVELVKHDIVQVDKK